LRLTISNEEIAELLAAPSVEFPKYARQLINLANQTAQATRPRVVGQMSDLINEFPDRTLAEWEAWYREGHPDAVEKATNRIVGMLENLKAALSRIDAEMVGNWVHDLVVVKTFVGLRFQEAVLKKLAETLGTAYRLAPPQEEARGVDGYLGDEPVSIKPDTYKAEGMLPEQIAARIVYYRKSKTGITVELDDGA